MKKYTDGFYIESPPITQLYLDNLSNKTEMVFWLLDLQKKGLTNKLISPETLFNMEWELIKGEHDYLELHGDIGFLLKDIKYSDNGFNAQKDDVFFKKLLLTKLNQFGLDKYIKREALSLDVDVLNIDFLTKEQKSVLSIKYDILFGDLIETTTPLIKHPYSSNQHLTTHFLQEEGTTSNQRMMGSGNSFYNELNSYVKLFGFDEGVGLNTEEAFKSFSEFGSRHARFKYLPTVVEDIDPAISLEDNLGYSNYFHKMNYEDLLPIY